MKRVGVATVLAAVVLVGSGCSSGGGEPEEGGSVEPSLRLSAGPAKTSWPGPSFPDTAAGRLDRRAYEEGWLVGGSLHGSPSAYVEDICESMDSKKKYGNPSEWLMVNHEPDGSEREVLRSGVPSLCPRWTATVKRALGGDFERSYSNGTYRVGSPGSESVIEPGTYRTKDDLEGCYWERTTEDGVTLDNQFSTAARSITVTIRASDGLFTSRECGTWQPVG